VLLCLVGCPGNTTSWGEAGGPTLEAGGEGPRSDLGALPDGFGKKTDAIEGCDPKSFVLQQAPPAEVYLVLDKSGSMAEPGADPKQTKWQELRAAVDFALSKFESSIRFGLLLYPSAAPCLTSGPQVRIDTVNKKAILAKLDATTPSGGTPTAAALNNAAQSLGDVGSKNAMRFVILATDGGPNCNYLLDASGGCTCSSVAANLCCTNHPESCPTGASCLDDTHVLQVIADLRQKHATDTFVIGLAGSSGYSALLDQMAVAGGRQQQGASSKYYAADSQKQLEAALSAIAGSVISCAIQLDETPKYPDKVKVYMDGQEIPRDTTHQNGWDYTDASLTRIELFGPACDTLQDGKQHDLTATFACEIG
jgi:hypothetical protein